MSFVKAKTHENTKLRKLGGKQFTNCEGAKVIQSLLMVITKIVQLLLLTVLDNYTNARFNKSVTAQVIKRSFTGIKSDTSYYTPSIPWRCYHSETMRHRNKQLDVHAPIRVSVVQVSCGVPKAEGAIGVDNESSRSCGLTGPDLLLQVQVQFQVSGKVTLSLGVSLLFVMIYKSLNQSSGSLSDYKYRNRSGYPSLFLTFIILVLFKIYC